MYHVACVASRLQHTSSKVVVSLTPDARRLS